MFRFEFDRGESMMRGLLWYSFVLWHEGVQGVAKGLYRRIGDTIR